MNPQGQEILDQLSQVSHQRDLRARDALLNARVVAVKRYQHLRFQTTYADLLAGTKYRKAAQFFLDDLYGPSDFTRRDAQFARVIPALIRLFPAEIVATVKALAELHALSEQLDTAMGQVVPDGAIGLDDHAAYATAWRAVGMAQQRSQQIALTQRVGTALDAYTRNPLLRHTLRLMRGPARMAGLSELQAFLELGFDTFREMRGAKPFLDIIVERETAFARRMFEAEPMP